MSTATLNGHARNGKAKTKTTTTAELLRSAAKAPVGKPQGLVFPGDLGDGPARYIELSRTIDEAERERALLRDQLRGEVDPWYQDEMRTSEHECSVKLPAGTLALRVTYQHRYTKLAAAESEACLRSIVGDDFDEYFKVTAGLRVRKDVAEDPERLDEVVQKLAKALGDEFPSIFEAEQNVAPTRAFTERRWKELTTEQNARIDDCGVNQVVVLAEQRGS